MSIHKFGLMMIFIVASSPIWAQSSEQKGKAIAVEADKRDTGFKDSTARMTMILRNAQGQTSKRDLRVKVLEGRNEGDKSLMIFDSPRDVQGTALLTYTHTDRADDQWLYLPALRRVKRISSSNQSGPFMGSEFAYEDFTSQEVEKYTYKYLKNEACGQNECFVIERYPKDKNSGYVKEVVWLDTHAYRVWQVHFYDRKNSHLKTLEMSNYQQYLNQYWRPLTMSMNNLQTHKSTTLQWSNYEFKTGLSDRDFSKTSLKRAY